jgi:hypothetical protein
MTSSVVHSVRLVRFTREHASSHHSVGPVTAASQQLASAQSAALQRAGGSTERILPPAMKRATSRATVWRSDHVQLDAAIRCRIRATAGSTTEHHLLSGPVQTLSVSCLHAMKCETLTCIYVPCTPSPVPQTTPHTRVG